MTVSPSTTLDTVPRAGGGPPPRTHSHPAATSAETSRMGSRRFMRAPYGAATHTWVTVCHDRAPTRPRAHPSRGINSRSMPSIRPNLAIVTLVLEVVWFAIAVAAYESAASDNVHSLAVTVAVIGVIWAAPAIAICLMAWL